MSACVCLSACVCPNVPMCCWRVPQCARVFVLRACVCLLCVCAWHCGCLSVGLRTVRLFWTAAGMSMSGISMSAWVFMPRQQRSGRVPDVYGAYLLVAACVTRSVFLCLCVCVFVCACVLVCACLYVRACVCACVPHDCSTGECIDSRKGVLSSVWISSVWISSVWILEVLRLSVHASRSSYLVFVRDCTSEFASVYLQVL